MSDAEPILTIVIPTYNRNDLLDRCLTSLKSQTFTNFNVVVVEDGGPPKTKNVVKEWFPDATSIILPENSGFAHAVNRGIESAFTDYIMLLNNDMVIEKECLEILMQHAHSQVCIGPLVLGPLGEFVYSAGDRIRANGRPESIGFREPMGAFQFEEKPFGITAGAAIYPGKLFETIGRFDEDFIAYFDDADFSARARLGGWDFQLVPEARAFHEGAASISNRLWWRTRQCHRNHVLLVLKNFPFMVLLKHLPAILAERLRGIGRVFSAVRADRGALGALAELTKIYMELFVLVPRALAKRLYIQRRRVASPYEFEKWLHD